MKFCAIHLCLFLALSLGGCAPNAVKYYQPTADSGNVLESFCVPTKSIIEFNLPGSSGYLHVRVLANNGKHVNQISIFFSGKEWSELHFLSTNFIIKDTENNNNITISSLMAYKSDGIYVLDTAPYMAPPERPGLPRFHLQINTPEKLPKAFKLISPIIVIDGEEIELPPIRFDQKIWMGLSPLNC